MRGAWRTATLKNARQKAVEAQAQEIIKIAIGLNATLCLASIISISHQPTQVLAAFCAKVLKVIHSYLCQQAYLKIRTSMTMRTRTPIEIYIICFRS